ncbi:MAG: DUF853 family protein [Methanomicrobiales archaeon]|nr:DUF853 family protein [Methanomicrobiales archaeon]
MNPQRSAILEETLQSMGYSPEDSADILQQLSPNVRDYLSYFNRSEIQGIIEALIFVYIAKNSHTTDGTGDGACERCCPGGTLALKQCGLVREASWQGVRVMLPTRDGARVGGVLVRKRIGVLDWGALASKVHPLVPYLLAGSSHYRYTEKTLPIGSAEDPHSFLGFITHRSSAVFRELEQFARLLAECGLAVIACEYPGSSAERWQYVFPDETVYILEAITASHSDDLKARCLSFVEYVRRKYLVLEFLRRKHHYDSIRASRELQADLITCLDRLADSVKVTKLPSHRGGDGGVQFIIADEERYRAHLDAIAASLQREVAEQFGASLNGCAAEERADEAPQAPLRERTGKSDAPSSPAGPPADPEHPAMLPAAPAERWQETARGDSSAYPPPERPAEEKGVAGAADAVGGRSPAAGAHTLNAGGDALAIFLGHSGNGDRVYWAPGTLNNGHFIIIGGSGAGKTETIRCIAAELARQGYPVLLIDFHGDMALDVPDQRTCTIREDAGYCFNPLELDPALPEITPLRATSDFVDAISINFPTLGIQQRRSIKGIIKEIYRRGGFTAARETWNRKVDFDEVEDAIMACEDETIPAYLEDIFDYKLFSGTEKIAIKEILAGGITHMNLNALPENLRYLFADLFLRRLFYSLQALGEIPRSTDSTRAKFRLFIIVDEAKLLVSQKTGQKQVIKAVLNKYATEMRKFGVSLILASQLISHFNDEILANIAVKLCMRTENKKQAQENSKFFEVSETDLMNFQPGEGILIIGSEKMNVKIVPTRERGAPPVHAGP